MRDLTHPNLALYLPLWKRDGASFPSEDAHGILCTVTGASLGALDGNRGRLFGASDDKIDISTDPIGILAATCVATISLRGWGAAGSGRILDNGQFRFFVYQTNTSLGFDSNGSNISTCATGSISLNRTYRVVITRTADGTGNFYINGTLNGLSNRTTGTPAAGTAALTLGNNAIAARNFDGVISGLAVYTNLVWSALDVVVDYQEYRKNRR